MIMRELGRSGLKVAPLALGGNVFGWTASPAQSFEVLDAFVEAGGNLIDTADMYSIWVPGHAGGESETIIGQWLASRGLRHKVLIATKVGLDMGAGRKGLSAPYVRAAVEDSLKRLGIDCIDLYQAHTDDTATPLDETLGAFADLIRAGKVRAIGASNYSATRLAQAFEVSRQLGLPRFETLQPQFNLLDRAKLEGDLQNLCVREGISVIPYYSLAAGFLSGKYRTSADLEGRARGGRVRDYLNERGLRVLAAVDAVAKRLGTSQTAVAIAWVRDRPAIAAPIASATSTTQLRGLIDGMRLALPADALAQLEEASA